MSVEGGGEGWGDYKIIWLVRVDKSATVESFLGGLFKGQPFLFRSDEG